MTPEQKLEILGAVESSPLPAKEALLRLEVPFSTYYRWRNKFRRAGIEGLRDRSPYRGRTWNQILPEERDKILKVADAYPGRSPREVSFHISDNCGFSVSESTVYRTLKAAGRIRPRDQRGFPAGAEYTVKTKRINELWQTDASHILVKNWGWYYLISVLDDYSRKILAWLLQPFVDTDAFSEVIERACEATACIWCPLSIVRACSPIEAPHSSQRLSETTWRPRDRDISSLHRIMLRLMERSKGITALARR
jgi:putative transposase